MNYSEDPYKLTTSYKKNPNRYKKMQFSRCGQSGLKMPKISLGFWQNVGGCDDFAIVKDILCTAFDSGITHFDLGNNYGRPPGSAESNLGRILKTELKSYRDEILISTKAGYDMWPGPYGNGSSRKYLIASCNQSLKRLGLDYVDIFYSHRFDPSTPLEETMGALDQIVRQGKALYIGISTYSAAQTRKADAILKQMGTPCLIHQASYSLFNHWIEKDLIETLEECGIGCIAFSTLSQGMLSSQYLKGIHSKKSRAGKQGSTFPVNSLTDSILKRLNSLFDIAKKRGQTLSQMALSWVLRDERITSALIGVSSTRQIHENVESLKNVEFDERELSEIEILTKDVNINPWAPVE